jgi:hypothetical protein
MQRPNNGAVEDIQRGKQGRGAMPLIVVRHGAAAAFLRGQAWLRAVECLDLTLFVDRRDDRVLGRVDIQPDDRPQFRGEPEAKKTALRSLVKTPLVYTSVALRNWRAFHRLGIAGVKAPGGYHSYFHLNPAVDIGGEASSFASPSTREARPSDACPSAINDRPRNASAQPQ